MFYNINNRFVFKYGKFDYEKAIQSAEKCKIFVLDNDEDELVTSIDKPSCYNCLFRRWTYESFTCMQKALNNAK